MVTTVKNYKKNTKTGKNEATGTSRVIGNVAQQGGGYAKGTVATQNSRGQVITQLPQNNNIQALSGPVYGIPQQQNIVPNTSTEQGAVFTPPPISIQGGGAPIPASFEQNQPPQSPAASSSPSSSPTAPQGEPTPYNFEQSLQAQGFESGAAAAITADDIIAVAGFTGLAKSITKSVIAASADVANSVARLAVEGVAKKGSVRFVANMERTGVQIATEEGAQAYSISSTAKAASGVVKEAVKEAGEEVVNPKTFLQKLKYINAVSKALAAPVIMAGSIAGLYAKSVSGETAVDDALTSFSASFVEDAQILRDAGYINEANAIYQCAEDVNAGLQTGAYDGIFTGKQKGMTALNNCKQLLSEGLTKVERDKAAKARADEEQARIDAEQKLIDSQIAADRAREDAQNFQREQQQSTQDFQRSEREARQTYEQQQQDTQYQRQLGLDATETQPSEGSTLNFGLLTAGGATEFVNKDKAAQYYFKSSYDELTPEQKMLLNLLKGGN